MNLRALLLLLCLAGLGLVSPRAHATTTCSASAPDIVVSGYDGTAQASANTNVTVTCSTDAGPLLGNSTVYVNLCLYIGNTPRKLVNGGNTLNYDLYTAAGTVWQGYSASPPAQQQVTLSYTLPTLFGNGTYSASANIQVSARIPAQSGLASGTYSQSFAGAATSADYRVSDPGSGLIGGATSMPASCKSGGNGGAAATSNFFPFTVSANVVSNCQIKTATDLAFGSVPGFITANVDQASVITLNCTNTTAWNVGLSNGSNASGNTRRMADGSGNYVTYELYRDTGRSLRWGNTINTDTLAGAGNGNDQNVTVYGRVPVQTATPGNYSDTITVTVNY